MKKFLTLTLVTLLAVALLTGGVSAARKVRVMVDFNYLNEDNLTELKKHVVKVNYKFPEINVVALTVKDNDIPEIKSLPGVKGVYRDNQVKVHGGLVSWNLDVIDVEKVHTDHINEADGSGVYVAVLDTGLLPNWKDYFPEEKNSI